MRLVEEKPTGSGNDIYLCLHAALPRVQRVMGDEMGFSGGDAKEDERFEAREQSNVTRPISATIDRPISNLTSR